MSISPIDHDSYNRLQEAMRLDLSKPLFVGRSDEQERIRKSFSEKKMLCLISGPSGVGKSLLAETALAAIEEQKLVGSGKFEQYGTRNTPFYAIIDAVDSILKQCATHSSTDLAELSSDLQEALGDEAGRLTPLLPHLEDVLKGADGDMEDISVASCGDQNASTYARLKHLFDVLLEKLSSHVRLVLHFEDLQWIDEGTLDLLQHLTVRKTIPNLFVIGSYRDDQVTASLGEYLRECENNKVDIIHIGNMTQEGTNELLSKYLELRLEETSDLAQLMHKKTAGNAFFMTQFLQALQDKQLLKYSLSTYKWEWDLEEVRTATSISDNIVGLVQDRVNHLPEAGRIAVQLAACLGSHFRADTLEGVVHHKATLKGLDVPRVLNLLAKFGLIEPTHNGWYKFVHDKIQQASYSLLEEGPVRDQLHLEVGLYLYEKLELSCEEEDWLLFGAVDQLNKASNILTNGAISVETVACLNYKAAKKAFSMSAFLPASEYCLKGSQVLNGPDKWTCHYDLALSICTLGTQACRAVGNVTKSREMIQEVVDNAKVNSDSLQVRIVEVEMLGHSGKYKDALCKGKQIVRQHGYHFPRKPTFLQAARSLMMTGSKILKMSDEDILALPQCKDEDVNLVSRVLGSIGYFSYLLDSKKDSVMASMLPLQIMLERGVTPFSSSPLVALGVIFLAMGKFDDSYRLGSLALTLTEKHHFRETYGGVIMAAQNFSIHLKKPIQTSLERYLLGYRTGMKFGDISNASSCNQGYCMSSYFSGLPLETLKEDWTKFLSEMVEYGQNTVRFVHLPVLQKVVNLTDSNSEDVFDFNGDLLNEKEYVAQAEAEKNLIALEHLYYSKAELAYMWGEFDAAGAYLRQFDALNSSSEEIPSFVVIRETFFRGLINIARARLHGGRKYQRRYSKQIRSLRKWTKAGNVNCVDMLALLLAEEMSVGSSRKNSSTVLPLYDKAILSATRTGFAQVEALASECAGRYLLSLNESSEASSYFQRSHECYTRWGAKAKVAQLEKTFAFRYGDASEGGRCMEGRLSGKTRFNGRSSMEHKNLDVVRRRS